MVVVLPEGGWLPRRPLTGTVRPKPDSLPDQVSTHRLPVETEPLGQLRVRTAPYTEELPQTLREQGLDLLEGNTVGRQFTGPQGAVSPSEHPAIPARSVGRG